MIPAGDINCFVNLFFSISGTVLTVISAFYGVIAGSFPKAGPQTLPQPKPEKVAEIIYAHVIAGMGATILLGSLYYSFITVKTQKALVRNDMTVMPYGINTPAAFAFIFVIINGAIQNYKENNPIQNADDATNAVIHAWRVGVVANMVSGITATICGFFGPMLVKLAPKASLMVALAGIGFTYLGIGQALNNFQYGLPGILPIGVTLLVFFGKVRLGPAPIAILVLGVGTIMGWSTGFVTGADWQGGGSLAGVTESFKNVKLYLPSIMSPDDWGVVGDVLKNDLGTIMPLAFNGAIGTMLNVHSASEAGDSYPMREVMIVDGLTTCLAAFFGSPLGTCVYIGHPQYRAQGGRIWYSVLTGICFCIFATTGLFAAVTAFIPPYAVSPLVLFVGLAINQDTFHLCAERHLPGAILGLFPAVADWVVNITNTGTPQLKAMKYGSLFVGILWSSTAIYISDHNFLAASVTACLASVMSAIGLIHAPVLTITTSSPTCAIRGGVLSKTGDCAVSQDEFNASPIAFAVGYLFLAVMLYGIYHVQQIGISGRPMPLGMYVPPPLEDEDTKIEDSCPEEKLSFIGSRCSSHRGSGYSTASAVRLAHENARAAPLNNSVECEMRGGL